MNSLLPHRLCNIYDSQAETYTKRETMFNRAALIFAGVTFVFSTVLFFLQNGELLGSLAAALLASGLAWLSYIMVYWVYEALVRKN